MHAFPQPVGGFGIAARAKACFRQKRDPLCIAFGFAPDGPGLVADFAADRGEGILGMSVKVGDLDTALSLVNHNTGLNLQTFKYKGRDRFLIPASLTHGFMIEMVE